MTCITIIMWSALCGVGYLYGLIRHASAMRRLPKSVIDAVILDVAVPYITT